MVFSSLPFLFIFLPVCLILYYAVPGWVCERTDDGAGGVVKRRKKDLRFKNAVLLVMSLVFYTAGEPVYVLLLVFCALAGWVSGFLIEKYRESSPKKAKAAAIGCVALCLSILFVFKYLGFFFDTLRLLPFVDLPAVKLTLPIGISFYTFQTISYDIDLLKGRTGLQRNFGRFLLFVSLFPQLIAGPILRYKDIEAQLTDRAATKEKFCAGIARFLCGCAKKVLIANTLGELVDFTFSGGAEGVARANVWFGVLAFSLQIYYDFSGYSDMAIGLGKMFGFDYAENFNYPYVSRSITEFWRRWHISLGTFFRDYVYIPLGGNRRHRVLNLFVVWLLTGLWHGAGWNFVIWGLYFFVLLVAEKFVLKGRLEKIPVLSNVVTLPLLAVGWAVFYFEDIRQCLAALGSMFGIGGAPLWDPVGAGMFLARLPVILVAVAGCVPAGAAVGKKMAALRTQRPVLWFALMLIYSAAMLFLCVCALVSSTYNPFLYFRF
ncbi:MAG: MBOAT family protein [Clostridia bacterium]|nr:MBOAT family protein [Clostridia bacterium]